MCVCISSNPRLSLRRLLPLLRFEPQVNLDSQERLNASDGATSVMTETSHRYRVGEQVVFHPSLMESRELAGTYSVERLLPP
jgi:hypothetical protein